MKTFEERYTAWLDEKLSGAELESFERELENREEAESDRLDVQKLRGLLRSEAPVLKNPDFFNHQLLARIEADQEKSRSTPAGRPWFAMPWLRVAMAGFAALVLGWMLGSMNPSRQEIAGIRENVETSGIASIVSAEPLESGISATVLQDNEDGMMVVWLDGLDYLPASYELQ